MRVVVLMMLGLWGLSIATGVAAADAASSEASPPAKATGELTEGERLFQGVWELNSDGSDMQTGTLTIDDRDFLADSIHGRYTGYVSIRSDTSPGQIDFTIENCECKFDGMTARGIFREDEGTIVFAAPEPGKPRPEAFAGLDVRKFMIVRASRAVVGPGVMPR